MKVKEYIEDQFRWFKKADEFVRKWVVKYYILLFVLGLVIGGIAHLEIPKSTEAVMDKEPLKEVNQVYDYWINNFIFIAVTIAVSYCSISLIGLTFIINGFIVGNLSVFTGKYFGIWFPILGFVPHGIFEIPAIFLAPLIGLKLRVKDKKGALKLLVITIILMIIAGVMEFYVTSALLDWYVVSILGIKI